MVNGEDFNEDFLKLFGNFVSPHIQVQSAVDPKIRNKI
jgi:hypothetical protein